MTETTETIYSKTLTLLERRGWHQGDGGYGVGGSLCLVRALRESDHTGPRLVMDPWWWAQKPSDIAIRAISQLLGLSEELFLWNDHPTTTYADVRAVLVEMHHRALDIGEGQKEVEFVPITEPATPPLEAPPTNAPAEMPAEMPAEVPVEEPVPV